MKLYKSYMFRNKDPVIDEMRILLQDHYGTGKAFWKGLRDVERLGGPSHACLDGWFTGATKRPQNATIEAAGRAIGMERRWVKANSSKK